MPLVSDRGPRGGELGVAGLPVIYFIYFEVFGSLLEPGLASLLGGPLRVG